MIRAFLQTDPPSMAHCLLKSLLSGATGSFRPLEFARFEGPSPNGQTMRISRYKPIVAVLLACYIDIAICGFHSPGEASNAMNAMSNWTILRPHTIGMAIDGSYFLELVLPGKTHGSMCWAMWQSPVGTYACPESTATIDGDVIGRPSNSSSSAEIQ